MERVLRFSFPALYAVALPLLTSTKGLRASVHFRLLIERHQTWRIPSRTSAPSQQPPSTIKPDYLPASCNYSCPNSFMNVLTVVSFMKVMRITVAEVDMTLKEGCLGVRCTLGESVLPDGRVGVLRRKRHGEVEGNSPTGPTLPIELVRFHLPSHTLQIVKYGRVASSNASSGASYIGY
jgi:hypothetical protein